MADAVSDDASPAQDWFQEIADEEPAPLIRAQRHAGADHGDDHSAHRPDRHVPGEPTMVDSGADFDRLRDLDSSFDDTAVEAPDVDAAAKRSAVWLGSAVLVVAVGIALAFAVLGGVDPGPPPGHHASIPAMQWAPSTTNPVLPQQDQAVPFTAHTDSCTPADGSSDQTGARSPQALTDTGSDSAWVCGRGPQESLVDGQILHIQFARDATRSASPCSYLLTTVSVTPGWVAKTAAGADDWLGHRVVRRLQFNFFNGDQLAADPFFLDTHNVHGPVTAALPSPILASRVEVIILHTERPPAAPPPNATAPGQTTELPNQPLAAGADSVLEPAPIDTATTPPDEPDADGTGTRTAAVDATFAMSQLQFLGHAPH